jgi:DnaJ-class molecular chaperone
VAARQTPAPVTADPEPAKCPTCKGSGEGSRTVHVGRKRRAVGEQAGLCLTCLGSGEALTD